MGDSGLPQSRHFTIEQLADGVWAAETAAIRHELLGLQVQRELQFIAALLSLNNHKKPSPCQGEGW
jgi:hypothetical protein